MRIPIRPIRGRWPASLEKHAQRFLRDDPRVLLADDADPDSFRSAMSNIHVGETIKITGSMRHPLSDALLTDNLDLTESTILDIGASDGSTSVDLIKQIGAFRSFIIADLYLEVTAVSVGQTIVFRDPAGNDILVAGTRLLAWPALSRIVRGLCYPYTRAVRSRVGATVLLLNPEAREYIATDDRIHARVHDIFEPWSGPSPDVIKVANVLRRLYFTDEQISRALGVLHASLAEGGHMLIVDNPRLADVAERGALYRRVGLGFAQVAATDNEPEICDLIDVVGRTPLPERRAS